MDPNRPNPPVGAQRAAPTPSGRHSIRLKSCDYREAGLYFVTICTHQRQPMFGRVAEGQMHLSVFGETADEVWHSMPCHRKGVELDAWVAMPNHVHGILLLTDPEGAARCALTGAAKLRVRAGSLPEVVRSFKSAVTKRCREAAAEVDVMVWQRNSFEHIIRNDHALDRIRAYIDGNPATWDQDEENPNRTGNNGFARWLSKQGPVRKKP